MAGMGYGQAIGAIMAGTGAVLKGFDAKNIQNKLNELANMPGVNPSDVYGETFGAMGENMGSAEQVAGRENRFNNEQLQQLLETSIPGYSDMQQTRTDSALAMLRGELPPDVAEQVFRNTNSTAVSGGYGGSPASSNLTARDLGLTSLDLIQQGQANAAGIIGSTPMIRQTQTNDLMNITARDLLATRSKERTEKLSIKGNAADRGGMLTAVGSGLIQGGGMAMGGAFG